MKALKWIGTIFSIIGSFVVAFQIFILGYLFFIIGSISWLVVAMITREKPLAILNGFFLCANVIGLYKVLQ